MKKLELSLKSENMDAEKIEENAIILRNRLNELDDVKVEFGKKEIIEREGEISKGATAIEWATLIVTFVTGSGGIAVAFRYLWEWKQSNPKIKLVTKSGVRELTIEGDSWEKIKEIAEKFENENIANEGH